MDNMTEQREVAKIGPKKTRKDLKLQLWGLGLDVRLVRLDLGLDSRLACLKLRLDLGLGGNDLRLTYNICFLPF